MQSLEYEFSLKNQKIVNLSENRELIEYLYSQIPVWRFHCTL